MNVVTKSILFLLDTVCESIYTLTGALHQQEVLQAQRIISWHLSLWYICTDLIWRRNEWCPRTRVAAVYLACIYYNNLRCWNIRLDHSLIPSLCSKSVGEETKQVCTDLQKYRISFIKGEKLDWVTYVQVPRLLHQRDVPSVRHQ